MRVNHSGGWSLYAASFSAAGSSPLIPGNQRAKVFRRSSFRTCTRVCSSRRAALGPTHLLFFHKALADHVVHGRLDKRCGDRLVVPVAVAVVRNERLVGFDIAVEFPAIGRNNPFSASMTTWRSPSRTWSGCFFAPFRCSPHGCSHSERISR